MVSDIVLLKELPDFVKSSVAAYVSCVSGALIKEEYLELIEKAGFCEVRVIGEAVFSVEFITSDPVVKTAIDDMNLPAEEVADIAASIVSIKVQGIKA